MKSPVHLYVIETNPERAMSLRAELADVTHVTVFEKYDEAIHASGGLDALVVSLIWAIELGLIEIPAPLHQTRVVRMPAYKVVQGHPRYAIPGVAIAPGESLNTVETTRLILRESFKAIDRFNESNPVKLKSFGADAVSMGLDQLRAGEATQLLSEAYVTAVA
ncbi:MAG TPA: hypothetical protein VGD64_09070 [Acidisarcina sp.]